VPDRVLVVTAEVLLHRAENTAGGLQQTFALRVVAEIAEELSNALFRLFVV
jgi:hypothetical protein